MQFCEPIQLHRDFDFTSFVRFVEEGKKRVSHAGSNQHLQNNQLAPFHDCTKTHTVVRSCNARDLEADRVLWQCRSAFISC